MRHPHRPPHEQEHRAKGHPFSVGDGQITWLEETAKTADEVLGNVFSNMSRPDIQTQESKDAISHFLSDGPKPQREIMEKMKAAGISEHTAKKAKQLLGVRSIKQGSVWFWNLPEKEKL